MTRPRILRRPSAAAAARHPYGLCNLSSSFHKMTKIKQLSKSENKKLQPTDIDSPVNINGTQQLKSTSAVIQQYKQKPTANENHLTSQQLEPRLVNNDYFVLDGPLVNRREATEQQSLHTISVTLSFAQNLSSLFNCPSSSSSAFEFHFELVGQAVHIKWQHPPTENTVVNNKAVTIGERATARILCGSSKLLRYLKQSMPQLIISLCNNNGSKISKTIVPVGDRLAATNDDDCLRLLNENERVINVSGIYQLQNQQSTASQMGVDILISKLGQLPQEEEEQDENQEEEEEDADIDAETAFCSSPVNLFPAEEEDKDLQLFLEESSIEELGMAGEKLKTAIRDAHQSELAFRRERRRLIRLFKSVQLIYETKRIDEKRQAAANVIASQMKEKQRLIEKQQLALNAEIQRQEKMARELRNKQQKRKQSKDDQRWTVVPAEDKKEDEEEVEISAKKKKIRFSVLRDTHNIIIPANKRKDISLKSKPIKKAKNKKKIVIQPKTDTATNGETKKKRKYRKRKTNRSRRLKVDEDNSSSDSEEDCCSAQPCLKPEEKKVKWVQCDGTCQLWFHYRCEGLENTDIDAKKDYICRQCRANHQPPTEEVILHSKSP